ncbi:multi-sensor hybrid histidine kinase [Gloeothece citriformis PCC 7424]|uniref:Circadian input-output histidine kinase CikA n=1 Tax=Gloeothece citriformis (strain PCC 7424) TaxID=65393 RepID=B7KJT6_GLOC7|nr:PAS domain S-box protein [Gloeothece citriformis]ACK69535.1 multi-sensor hybrid histidine kinase [Gloeothece citriformis PCC 7424]
MATLEQYKFLEEKNQQLEAELEKLRQEQQKNLQIQEKLTESEERWQLVLRGTNDGIWDWNLKTNELFLSPRWKEMLGYQDEELENHFKTWRTLLHPKDVERVMETLHEHFERKTDYYVVEFRLRCKDGSYKWILSRGQALWDHSGKPVRMAGSHTDISDRKARQSLLRSLIDCIPDLIFYKDAQGIYRICNKAFAEFVGCKDKQIIGKTDFDLFPETLALKMRDYDHQLMTQKNSRRHEEWVDYCDGSRRLLDTLKTPLLGADGELLGVIGISRDITDRKQKEKALEQQAQRDHLLSNIARQLIDQELDTAINYILQATGDLTGSDHAYIIRFSDCQGLWSMSYEWCNPLNPNVEGEIEKCQNLSVNTFPWFAQQLLSGKIVKINQLKDIPPDATAEQEALKNSLTPSMLIVPMINAGKTLGYLGLDAGASKKWTKEEVNLLKLIGEFIAIAEARQEAKEALQESEARFAGILDNANEAIISIDESHHIRLFNHAAEKIFGYGGDEVMGKPFDLLLPSRYTESHRHYLELFEQGDETAREMGGREPVFGRRKDEREFLAEVSISKLNQRGKTIFTAIVRDITERKQAEEALKKAKEAADNANRAKSEFLASMSHELRTPLNAILGFTQVLGRNSYLTEEDKTNLDIISRSGEHLLDLINDILEMSKIEAGRTTFNEGSFDLYQLLDSLENMLRLRAEAKGLQLIFDRVSDVPQFIQTDEGKLRQVLINLLGNAIKFTEQGGVTLRVKTGGMMPSSLSKKIKIIFEIEDTGLGIASEEIDKLFEAFGQTESGRNSHQGTGLGLPISQKFVELMGGKIGVNSILGRGSIFTFDIRVKLAEAQQIKTNQPIRKVIGLAPNQPKYRILAVDDRLESRLLLTKLLTTMGFDVREATNGKEALEIWEDWHPHLIWMDMRMPVMDGYEATQEIKSSIQGQATVIIALTASAFEEDRTIVLSAGCDDFMRKPFREEMLWEKMAQHLGVSYIYEDLSSSTVGQDTSSLANIEHLKSEMMLMSPSWIEQLNQAACECNDERILELIESIPLEQTELIKILRNLANNYRFDQIIELGKI